MVSKARDDLPLPLIPVMTTSLFLGIEISIFLRLCSLAPKTSINSSCECPLVGNNSFFIILFQAGKRRYEGLCFAKKFNILPYKLGIFNKIKVWHSIT